MMGEMGEMGEMSEFFFFLRDEQLLGKLADMGHIGRFGWWP
jgi:hypothetical protein